MARRVLSHRGGPDALAGSGDRRYSDDFPTTNGVTMRFLRLAEVRNRVGYGRATIYRLMETGQFPRSYSLGARAVAWLESEIDAWIEARVKAGQAAKN